MERKTGYNIGLAIWRLTCFYETFVLGSTAGILLNFCAKNPPHRQAEKRCAQYYRRDFQTKLMRFFLTLNCSFCWLNSESEFTFEKLTALTIGA